MKAKTLQVAWHTGSVSEKNDPILSLDFHPTMDPPLLATAGSDSEVKVRGGRRAAVPHENGAQTLLSRAAVAHEANGGRRLRRRVPLLTHVPLRDGERGAVVAQWHLPGVGWRWCAAAPSPCPCVLSPLLPLPSSALFSLLSIRLTLRVPPALRLTDQAIVVVKPAADKTWDTVAAERDTTRAFLRGHHSDVYDVAWAPDSSHLVSGSVDRTVFVWDVTTMKDVQRLQDHSSFVQGVAWDPLDKFIATQGCDRTARVYARTQRKTGQPFKAVPVVSDSPVRPLRCVCWGKERAG